MADIKTLDQRIREDAQKKLRDRIEIAAKPMFALLNWSSLPIPGLYRKNNADDAIPADSHTVFKAFCDHLFAENVEREERIAIEAFLERVESLQQQVNELRDLSHEHD